MTDETQKILNDALYKAACDGKAGDVLDCLEKGAHPDGNNNGLPLIYAAYSGHLAVVNILLDAGASTEFRDRDGNAADNARKKGYLEIASILENPRPSTSADEVVLQRPFRDRLHFLEEIFNFVTLERVSLLRFGKHGKIEAMTITGFSAIEDKSDESQLRKAFNEHVQRGGKTDEALIFPNRLAKPILKRGD
ncbi:MAG: hypothetical protein K8R48_00850 [Alphaproteobacteria bacterium]|nr:hypothetical protein [Alphaproteobacteria bacterium]